MRRLLLLLVLMSAVLWPKKQPLPEFVLTSDSTVVSVDSLISGDWTLLYFYRGFW